MRCDEMERDAQLTAEATRCDAMRRHAFAVGASCVPLNPTSVRSKPHPVLSAALYSVAVWHSILQITRYADIFYFFCAYNIQYCTL